MKLFPNPAQDQTNLALNGLDSMHPTTVWISDAHGRQQILHQVTGESGIERSIDLNHLASGLYQISVINGNHRMSTQLIIVD